MFLGFFPRFKHLPGCRNIQVRDWLNCWSCIFYFLDLVPIKMGQNKLGGSLWEFVNFFTMIAYIFHLFHIICSVFVCITTTTTRSISLLLVWLVFDWHGQLRSMHHSFWTAGGNNIIPKQAVNKDATVFFELYHSSRKSFIYVSSVVCCVCCCLNVLWSHLYDVIWCYRLLFMVRCSLFVVRCSLSFRFIPIHSASISWNNFTLGNCTQRIWFMYHRRAKARNWPNQAMVFWNNWTTTPRGVFHRKILWRIKVFEMMVRTTCTSSTRW